MTPAHPYRLVVLDFDGTLADTLASALRIYNTLADRHGFDPVADPEAVREMTIPAFLKKHRVPLLRLPGLVKEYLALQRERIADVRLFDGWPGVLRSLHRAGIRLGVLSSNSAENIAMCLQLNGVDGLFDFVVGYPRLFGKHKAMRRLLKREGVAPAQFLYVGDETRDIEAAGRAGVDVAAATWGFHTEQTLARHRPRYVLREPGHILDRVFPGLAGEPAPAGP